MERAYDHFGKRTKRAVERVIIDALDRDYSNTAAFNVFKEAIAARVQLAHRDKKIRLCI